MVVRRLAGAGRGLRRLGVAAPDGAPAPLGCAVRRPGGGAAGGDAGHGAGLDPGRRVRPAARGLGRLLAHPGGRGRLAAGRGHPAVARGRADAPAASLGWTLFAIPAVLAAWSVLALMYLSRGGAYVVSLLALVWVADIAAYFAGRAFGKRKLAPRVSPGKTVAGAVAGVLGAVAWIALSSQWDGTYGQALVERWSWWLALPAAALLGVVSIVGDLFESLLKRRAGRKDSSALLPGHGGVYDRIDAILPVAPLALLMSGVLF
ncbi:phosphatidate cytidylyltransferase-like protein [Bordetella pertussis STO1-CHOC-0018]|nr:phosphatidate cytidylyltransferase-like protein [Bordetella pertussis STO1-CHOC-0018]